MSAAGHASATGQVFAAIDWLDAHFETAGFEYEAIADSVGFQPGCRVLDAGCGTGGFLPLLAELVGPSGALAALDIEAESITAIQERLAGWALPCHVETRVGGLDELPYADASFDAVWCANVTQYLGDEDLLAALAECRRVVRPGGLVAIKDVDGNLMRAPSRVPSLIQHLREARIRAGSTQALGAFRGPELRIWLHRAGLLDISLRTTLVERWPPYRPAERNYIGGAIRAFARMAKGVDIPQHERDEWARLISLRDALLDAPDHYFREGNILAVDPVPE